MDFEETSEWSQQSRTTARFRNFGALNQDNSEESSHHVSLREEGREMRLDSSRYGETQESSLDVRTMQRIKAQLQSSDPITGLEELCSIINKKEVSSDDIHILESFDCVALIASILKTTEIPTIKVFLPVSLFPLITIVCLLDDLCATLSKLKFASFFS